ncbi:uncharacterized protein LOC111673929 [Orussus abietinus]|uniref:uncharacterized protein LOC111673929 n=1 Tax=Orussus abietinus TaxID=222816 RepID=UPI000C715D52|nr:uncharacterized protein LOC111673929 [Orussus abietinus]XP_023287933.1 uncharacterized protein LOC111673929 [Orussus abietinus]XP_023287934.1 uncharacterized protein LOC111673929 [Orussus abietinus]XP_023287935.1 uncharacterized protein LOC111673929 [Orussus abietinus]XP_023287936.1 uncharacterized protein LOC111673929 [Orussus abietinus]XP_023287937.1 uncharacterized protein LOC111673929 [Orussus abietinus]
MSTTSALPRVEDLERSQQWAALRSDIDDFERIYAKKVTRTRAPMIDAPEERQTRRRSMPEQQRVDIVYGKMAKNQSATSKRANNSTNENWGWKPRTEFERRYFSESCYQRIEHERKPSPTFYENEGFLRSNASDHNGMRDSFSPGMLEDAKRDPLQGSWNRAGDEKVLRFFGNEGSDYQGSRERLHEIFEHNRFLRRQFFANLPANENNSSERFNVSGGSVDDLTKRNHDVVARPYGNGFGSTETVTSQSNQSASSIGEKRSRANFGNTPEVLETRGPSGSPRRSQKFTSRDSKEERVDESSEFADKIVPKIDLRPNVPSDWKRYLEEGERKVEIGSDVPRSTCNFSRSYNIENTNNQDDAGSGSDVVDFSVEVPELKNSEVSINESVLDNGQTMDLVKKASHSTRDNSGIARASIYEVESEGLKLLNSLESRIEARKETSSERRSMVPLSSNPSHDDYKISPWGDCNNDCSHVTAVMTRPKRNRSYDLRKSLPNLSTRESCRDSSGSIARLSVNGLSADVSRSWEFDLNAQEKPKTSPYFPLRPAEATKLYKSPRSSSRFTSEDTDQQEEYEEYALKFYRACLQLSADTVTSQETRRVLARSQKRIPPPLDLSRVYELADHEDEDRKMLKNYAVDVSVLQNHDGPQTAVLTVINDEEEDEGPRQRIIDEAKISEALFRTSEDLLELSSKMSRISVKQMATKDEARTRARLIAAKALNKSCNDISTAEDLQSPQLVNNFKNSMIDLPRITGTALVRPCSWMDGSDSVSNGPIAGPTSEHRMSPDGLTPGSGTTVPSVYGPIPYSQYSSCFNTIPGVPFVARRRTPIPLFGLVNLGQREPVPRAPWFQVLRDRTGR